MSSGGTLPRATQSPSLSQIDLKDDFVSGDMVSAGQTNILFSHFTQANYALDTPITDRGEINCNDNAEAYSRYDHGSTKIGRSVMYGEWLHKRHFDFTLSGHSHRAGLYRCVEYNDNFLGMDSLVFRKNMTVAGGHPAKEDIQQIPWRDQTKLLVSASTGPIPKQNIKGEMSGFGMESPSGSRVELDGQEKITLVTSRKSSAKPRFCVACDYIDLLKDGFWEYFNVGQEFFQLKLFWGKIHPELSLRKKENFINKISIWLYEDGPKEYSSEQISLANDVYHVQFPTSFTYKLKSRKKFINAIFMSVFFDLEELVKVPEFSNYDFSSP